MSSLKTGSLFSFFGTLPGQMLGVFTSGWWGVRDLGRERPLSGRDSRFPCSFPAQLAALQPKAVFDFSFSSLFFFPPMQAILYSQVGAIVPPRPPTPLSSPRGAGSGSAGVHERPGEESWAAGREVPQPRLHRGWRRGGELPICSSDGSRLIRRLISAQSAVLISRLLINIVNEFPPL